MKHKFIYLGKKSSVVTHLMKKTNKTPPSCKVPLLVELVKQWLSILVVIFWVLAMKVITPLGLR